MSFGYDDSNMEREAALFNDSLSMAELMTEGDKQYAYATGERRTTSAWVLSDRDVWYRNPHYLAPEYILDAVHDKAGHFLGWMVALIEDDKPGVYYPTAAYHDTPLAAWREMRFMQERDAIRADTHPEAAVDEDFHDEGGELEACANERLMQAWKRAGTDHERLGRDDDPCDDLDIPF